MTSDLVIFDLDGTLVESDELFFTAFSYAACKVFDVRISHTLIDKHVGESVCQIVFKALKKTPSKKEMAHFQNEFSTAYKNKHNILCTQVKDVKETLKMLKRRGDNICIATSRRSSHLELAKEMDFFKYVSISVGVGKGVRNKPYPDLIDKVISIAKRHRNVFYIGDTMADYLAAKSSKHEVRFIGATWVRKTNFSSEVVVISSIKMLPEFIS